MATSTIKPKSDRNSLAFTRVENSYVNATDFARIQGRYSGIIGIVNFNLVMSVNLPTGSGWVTIGTMSPKPTITATVCVPCQNNTSTILVSLETDGSVKVLNGSGQATGSNWFRASIPIYLG